MKVPTYQFKVPDESAWLAVAVAVGSFLAVLLPMFGLSSELTGAVVALVSPLIRFIYGWFAPSPTE